MVEGMSIQKTPGMCVMCAMGKSVCDVNRGRRRLLEVRAGEWEEDNGREWRGTSSVAAECGAGGRDWFLICQSQWR